MPDTRAIERNPFWVKPILETGAEISLGGYRWRDNLHEHVEPKVEDEEIQKSIDILQSATGDKSLPKGRFLSQDQIAESSANSCGHLSGWFVERRSNLSTKLYSLAHESRQLPLVYSSDSCQDDLPYWNPSPAGEASKGLLMVPFSYDTSDLRFNMRGSGWASPADWATYLVSWGSCVTVRPRVTNHILQKDTFDCLYEEAEANESKMMTIVLHPHICGRPNRSLYLER